jgi:hypothetical protein
MCRQKLGSGFIESLTRWAPMVLSYNMVLKLVSVGKACCLRSAWQIWASKRSYFSHSTVQSGCRYSPPHSGSSKVHEGGKQVSGELYAAHSYLLEWASSNPSGACKFQTGCKEMLKVSQDSQVEVLHWSPSNQRREKKCCNLGNLCSKCRHCVTVG